MDTQLWRVDRFRDFLSARRELISNNLNEFLEGFTSPDEGTTIRPVAELIEMGEGSNLEFKSTLQWDVAEDRQNKALRDSVLKTLAAFMNSDGGNLLIGVEDSGHIFGLHKDLNMLDDSEDRFLQLLSSLIADKLGPHSASSVSPQVEDMEGKTICVEKTSKSSEPAFLDGQRGREFFIRVGNTTRALDPEQTLNYIEHNGL